MFANVAMIISGCTGVRRMMSSPTASACRLPPAGSMASGKLKSRARKALSWWKGRGTEQYAHCLHSYHYEIEYRCVACERGLCTQCAIVRGGDLIFCPECDR